MTARSEREKKEKEKETEKEKEKETERGPLLGMETHSPPQKYTEEF
eukprot:CAMPEP_0201510686 /NCGR_PEP_ID=MMETSP0161_2-20130828/3273_1 /ASSEMBLY_ACC=CAM_ASM_000251 /TAXON_ID=180227 /ORGANISM="Neoparamoeba aestuarina, Strain SoJaBio B1-5/56/2" /LENGTH=45 /DNA_ID= /DNA_START= /DNA_END= /DNA_ORIENTATION=